MPASSIPVSAFKGGVFALGNFDGVHRGHQAVVKTAIDKARIMRVPARVLTFEPHPRSVFKPDIPPFRLTPPTAKERLLRSLGIDDVIVRAFTPEFSRLSATDFVEQVLINECGAQHVVAGFDFVFGHGRGGDIRKLREWLTPHGAGVTEVTPFRDSKGDMMSATRAREALQAGDPAAAAHILGRPWSIAGVIEKGRQKGRTVGAPTANIALGEYLRPAFGVYAVNAGPVGGPLLHQGVANIGVRPTVGGDAELLEFHLFGFNKDIYGQEWEAELIQFLRPERKFANLEELRGQIAQDMAAAKAILASGARVR